MTLTWLLLAVTILVVGWLVRSWFWPWQRCPRCRDRVSGSGWGSTSKAFNLTCRKCGSTGRVVRIGARLISKATDQPVRGPRK